MPHILARLKATTIKSVMLALALSAPLEVFAADDGFLIGSALQKLSIAEYLRTAFLRSECIQFVGTGERSQLHSKKYQRATDDLESRLSSVDRTEFRRLAQSAAHQNRLAGYERTYITDHIATAKQRGTQLAFACGTSYNQVGQVMQRAELAYDEAIISRR